MVGRKFHISLFGDGRTDLAVVNQFDLVPGGASVSSAPISILLGNGDGTFQAAPDVVANGGAKEAIIATDFNSDGHLDLGVVNGANYVSILLGRGDGTFERRLLAGVGNYSISVTVGDFNHDGRPDLATANYESGTVSILINDTKRRRGRSEN
jgi:hypothetical protein